MPTTPFAFGRDVLRARKRRRLLSAMVRELRAMNTSSPCRLLWGHFTYAPPPDERVRYVNMVREPVARWRSLRDFYLQHSPAHPVTRATLNASACLLRHAANANASRACVAAEDAHMADVLFATVAESRACDLRSLFGRYRFIAALEEQAAHVPHMLRLLGLSGLATGLANRTDVLPHLYRTKRGPHSMRSVGEAERRVLEAELACDVRLYRAVRSQPLRAELSRAPAELSS